MTVSTASVQAWAAFSPIRAVPAPRAKAAARQTGASRVGRTRASFSRVSKRARWRASCASILRQLGGDRRAARGAVEHRPLAAIDVHRRQLAGVVDAQDLGEAHRLGRLARVGAGRAGR